MARALTRLSRLTNDELKNLSSQEKSLYAEKIGFPVELFDQLVANPQIKHHFQNQCPYGKHQPKGEHPNAFALIKDTASLSLTSTANEQLKTKHIEDQIRALAKEYFYRQLETAIEEVWANLSNWREQNNALVGTIKEVPSNNNQTVMALIPLTEHEENLLQKSPSLEALFCQMIYYTRRTWGATVMQWSSTAFNNGKYDRFVPGVLIPSRSRVNFEEILWRGINTAIKILFSMNYLLLQFSKNEITKPQWLQLQQHNYSFAALLAGTSLSTFEPLEHKLIRSPSQQSLDYLLSNKIISQLEPSSLRTGFEMLDADYFKLSGDDPAKASLDFADEKLSYVKKLPLLGDVILRKCPALKVGVVKEMHQWINKISNHYIEKSEKFPWQK